MVEPMRVTGTAERFDVMVTVVRRRREWPGRRDPTRHLAGAGPLRRGAALPAEAGQVPTRDARAKERKKVGLKRARTAPQ